MKTAVKSFIFTSLFYLFVCLFVCLLVCFYADFFLKFVSKLPVYCFIFFWISITSLSLYISIIVN